MKLVLFGAGASVEQGKESSPALVSNLLSELESFAPSSWGALSDEHRKLISQNFEQGIEHILEEAWPESDSQNVYLQFPHPYPPQELFPYVLLWDMAEYFIRFIPKQDSLYQRLLYRICSAKSIVALSSLNYDCLLIRDINYLHNCLPSRPSFKVCFPHGNAAFYCKGLLTTDGVLTAPANSPVEFNLNGNGHLISNGELGIFEDISHLRKMRSDYPLCPPVICHITPNKFISTGANIIKEQQLKLRQMIKQADKIVIIGMNINENDHHIWSPLAEAPGRILYISGKTVTQTFFEWSARHKRLHDHALASYWNEAEANVYDFLGI